MEQTLDMNNNFITNVKDPVNLDHCVNKKYTDAKLGTKADLSKTTTQTFQGRVQVPDFNPGQHNGSDIVNLRYINGIFLNKNTGGTLSNPITFLSSLPNNQKQIHNLGSPKFNSSATNKRYVDSEIAKISSINTTPFLKKDGSVSMTGNLDLNNNKIINLQTDYRDSKSAVNVDFVQEEISDLSDLVTQKIYESQIINSGQKRDAFRYLMEDTDESSSENNIKVLGINDFPNTPHQINKKAYFLQLLFKKNSPNQYQSRLGFNLYKLPVGYYTLVVEWFPPEMNGLSVTPQGTTISISKYATKTFEKYTKTVINFHRWGSSPPQFIYLDLHGTVSNPSFLTIGHLIVYGVKETISNVDPSVYDTAFVIKNGKMVMETDLDLNNHKIINLDDPLNEGDACNKRSLNIVETKLNDLSSNLSETLFWERYQLADCLYKIDRGSPSEVTFDNSTRAVSDLFDQSLKENDANQATQATKPILCTKAEKNNYRYYLKFDGSKRMLSNINLNPGSGQADIVNVFIVYRLNSYTGSYAVRNGLFGHDNGGYDKFIAFSPTGHLLVSGTTNQHIVIGPSSFNSKNATAPYQSKANAGELNKWICLSIHWDVPGGNNASETWCNGKKLANFTARTSQGSTDMTFGDLNSSGTAGLKGNIAFFCLYKGKNLTESNIKLHHYVLCKWYAVDHDPISLN